MPDKAKPYIAITEDTYGTLEVVDTEGYTNLQETEKSIREGLEDNIIESGQEIYVYKLVAIARQSIVLDVFDDKGKSGFAVNKIEEVKPKKRLSRK